MINMSLRETRGNSAQRGKYFAQRGMGFLPKGKDRIPKGNDFILFISRGGKIEFKNNKKNKNTK
jgi:ribosomal protein L27